MPVFFFFFGCDKMKCRVGILQESGAPRQGIREDELVVGSGLLLSRKEDLLASVMWSFVWFESVSLVEELVVGVVGFWCTSGKKFRELFVEDSRPRLV
jgi:hypothetical protein